LYFFLMTRFNLQLAFATITRSMASLRAQTEAIFYSFKGVVWDPSTEPLPPTVNFYGIPMVSIYSSNFLDQLIINIKTILNASTHSSPYFNFIIEVQLTTGQVRTAGNGFIVEKDTDLNDLRTKLEGYIENFETQSGTPEDRQEQSVVSSLIKVFDRSNAPAVNWNDPLALPRGFKESDAPRNRTSPKATAEKLNILNSQINELKTTQVESTKQIVDAIRELKTSPIAATPS
ncbi:hypothetical protein RhiirA4_294222, partial [Rhizophagus irregularis]